MNKLTFEIEHPSGDTYMAFEVTVNDDGKIAITKNLNCSLADIDGDYIFDTDNNNYRIQADWFTHPDSYEEMTNRFENTCKEYEVKVEYF